MFRQLFWAALTGCVVCSISPLPTLAEDRLINEAAEPPLRHAPDWAEPVPPPPSEAPQVQAATAYSGPMAAATSQPYGALSGRIVFMNGGHGWTYDPNVSPPWRLLRPVLQGMNEDYGNVDQLNFFAMYCFNAGAVVVPFRPLGQQTNQVILDNDDAAVTWSGSWANSSSTIFYGSAGDAVPYRYASLASAETATATYTPNIPVAGYYPVYTWARSGSDRGDQLYRIRHTGGESQVRIPHHMVGNGWVFLGEYYFNSGSSASLGSVVISNLRGSADGSVVIADAIRFGNGMGATDTGGGGSGYPSEDESARYWIRTSLGQGQSSSLYNGSGNDESDSWSAPPKMSAEMNRQEAGDILKRAHISFHSNAGGGRGTLALITSDETPYQTELAGLAGREVNDDLVALGAPPLEVAWNNRSTVTYTGGYSEIDGSLFNYEMPATIIEVAFHDDVSDAKLLRDSKARAAVGKAAMHALVKFMHTYDTNSPVPLAFLPEPPGTPRAVASSGGNIVLSWSVPVNVGGSQNPTNYIIYRSTDGYGFGNPISVGNTTSYTVSGLAPDTDYYFRISASNAGGESMPSQVVGCRASSAGGADVLVVNAFDRLDRISNLRQNTTVQSYSPPSGSGTIERVWPRRVNSYDYVVQHGKALAAHGNAFDSCQSAAIANNQVSLGNYRVVIWACGNDAAAQAPISSTEQSKLATYLAQGGALFVSGTDVAGALAGPSSTAGDRTFLQTYLHAGLANSNSAAYTVTPVSGGTFVGNANATVDNGSRGIYWAQMPDVLLPNGVGAISALNYSGGTGGAAALQYDGSSGLGKVILFGFPFETISAASTRNAYMADVLNFLAAPVATNQPPKIVGQPESGQVAIGATMAVSTIVTGSTPLVYQWRLNGAPLSGATSRTYTKTSFQAYNSGFYDLVASNAFGAVTSQVALIEATAPPVLQDSFYDDFDTNSASRWAVNKSSADTRIAFNYNYANYGIPASPGSSGTTRGVKFEANMTAGAVAAINISPTGGNFASDFRLSYSLWINANGPFPAGGTGSTQHGTAGVGTTGDRVQWTSGSANGTWFAVDGEGQASTDFYACSGATAYDVGSGVYLSGTASDARDNGNSYYTARFPGGQQAPALQQSTYPQQTGGLAAGTIGFAWRQVEITKIQGTVEWFIDGFKVASVSAASLPGINFFIGYWDSFSSLSDNTNLSFSVVDNVRLRTYVTNVPPYITTQPQGETVKEGAIASFSVYAGGTPALGYQWRRNGVAIPGANSPTYVQPSVQVADEGVYSVQITNVAGTVASVGAVLTVTPLLPLQFDGIELLSQDQFELTLSGEPGTYTIFSSGDLTGWTPWTNVTISSAPVTVVGTATNGTTRFFRAAPAQ